MRVVLDACVLYPTLLRELVTGWAAEGGFTPLWSTRILEEWRRAAARNGARDGEIAATEIAGLVAAFPDAEVKVDGETLDKVSLPDPDDAHVLAAAIDGDADEILTLNLRDFPTNALAAHGIIRRHPDEFLLEALHDDPARMTALVARVLARAQAFGIDTTNRRKLLKRAKLPRFAKAMDQI